LKNNTLKRVIADGSAYDNKENFRYLYDSNIEAAIKVRKSSNSAKSSHSVGCYCPIKIAVLKQLKNFEKWKHSVSYGHRWTAESVFSSIIKRC
jgi:Transposase DDE domain